MLAVKTAGIKYAIAVTLKAHSCRSERETEKEQEKERERELGREQDGARLWPQSRGNSKRATPD